MLAWLERGWVTHLRHSFPSVMHYWLVVGPLSFFPGPTTCLSLLVPASTEKEVSQHEMCPWQGRFLGQANLGVLQEVGQFLGHRVQFAGVSRLQEVAFGDKVVF